MADRPLFNLDTEGRWRLAYDSNQWVLQRIMVSGGGLAVCAASLLRFWTVAVSKNSSRAPDRPLSLSLI